MGDEVWHEKKLSVRNTSGRNNKQKGSLFKVYVMKMPYINRVRSMFWCLLWVLFVFFLMSKNNLLFSFLIESGLVSILLCFWDGFRLCCLDFVFSERGGCRVGTPALETGLLIPQQQQGGSLCWRRNR